MCWQHLSWNTRHVLSCRHPPSEDPWRKVVHTWEFIHWRARDKVKKGNICIFKTSIHYNGRSRFGFKGSLVTVQELIYNGALWIIYSQTFYQMDINEKKFLWSLTLLYHPSFYYYLLNTDFHRFIRLIWMQDFDTYSLLFSRVLHIYNNKHSSLLLPSFSTKLASSYFCRFPISRRVLRGLLMILSFQNNSK